MNRSSRTQSRWSRSGPTIDARLVPRAVGRFRLSDGGGGQFVHFRQKRLQKTWEKSLPLNFFPGSATIYHPLKPHAGWGGRAVRPHILRVTIVQRHVRYHPVRIVFLSDPSAGLRTSRTIFLIALPARSFNNMKTNYVWAGLYEAAPVETDDMKLPSCLLVAKSAIDRRLLEMGSDRTKTSDRRASRASPRSTGVET